MNIRLIVFLSIVIALLCFSSFYVGNRLLGRVAFLGEYTFVVWSVLLLFIVMQVAEPFFYRSQLGSMAAFRPFHFGCYLLAGVFACFLAYLLIGDGFLLLQKLIPIGMRLSDKMVFTGVCALTIVTVVFGMMQALSYPSVRYVDIPIANLPQAFDGFTIAQISDVHVGPTIGRTYVEHLVKVVNSLNPDLIAVTGDVIDGYADKLRDDVEPFSGLQAKQGVFFVLGNHEYYWDAQAWSAVMHSLGMHVLNNAHVVLQKEGHKMVIAGVIDYAAAHVMKTHKSDPNQAFNGAPQGAVRILLAHQPVSYKQAEGLGVDLQLSGHTHAGQFFPWSLLVKLAQPYFKGLYRHGEGFIYVNSGTGYWGPPLRFMVPAEITLLRLRCA